jgi:hypothetical protein
VRVFFSQYGLKLFCPGWPWSSWVGRITGPSHWCVAGVGRVPLLHANFKNNVLCGFKIIFLPKCLGELLKLKGKLQIVIFKRRGWNGVWKTEPCLLNLYWSLLCLYKCLNWSLLR